jgi:hypothetical protein
VVAVSALAVSACGLLCSEKELLAVEAPGRALRARAVTRTCDRESWLAVVLVDARTGGQTVLVESTYVARVKLIWPSASVLRVTLMDVSPNRADHITERAVRRVGNVAIEYYLSNGDRVVGLSEQP